MWVTNNSGYIPLLEHQENVDIILLCFGKQLLNIFSILRIKNQDT